MVPILLNASEHDRNETFQTHRHSVDKKATSCFTHSNIIAMTLYKIMK